MTKRLKYLLFSGMGLLALLFLSGCVQTNRHGVPTGDGFIYNVFVRPMGTVIQFLASNWGLGYGWAIILITALVRLVIILPLGISQSWRSTYQAEKRNYLQPLLEPLNERLRNAQTQEERLAAQQELMRVQRENGISVLGGIGCLPIIIQWPFFTGLFYSTRYTPGIASASFFGIKLGEQSLLFVVLTGILYLFQGWLSTLTVPEEQRKTMRQMMFVMPIMMLFFTWTAPAGGALYWLISGVFGVLQQLITMYWIRPIMKARIDKEFEENPPKIPDFNARKDVTPNKQKQVGQNNNRPRSNHKGRNAGKQRSR